MKQFFQDIDSLHRFTLELDTHQDQLPCQGCSAVGQWVSHGFVYRYHHHQVQQIVGKRIFCSNRHGRSGCGRTRRLYLAGVIPRWRYCTLALSLFLCALIAGASIVNAYTQATHAQDARNAYRWLHQLQAKITTYRTIIGTHNACSSRMFTHRVRRLQILLPTLHTLLDKFGDHPIQQYQILQQQRFV